MDRTATPARTQRPAINLKTIISGGQTGVDRGALDAALALNFHCGGWCPRGRRAEDGIIPEHYPLTSLAGGSYEARTCRNVVGSDATLLIYDGDRSQGKMTTGTLSTRKACEHMNREHLVINADETSVFEATQQVIAFLETHPIATLNVAGPRASLWRGGHDYSAALIRDVLRVICR